MTVLRFGLVLTSDQHCEHAIGLLAAAHRRNWDCRCFLTDRGVRVLTRPAFLAAIRTTGTRLDVCEHSWELFAGGQAPVEASMGGQYQDAELVHLSDKVLVL